MTVESGGSLKLNRSDNATHNEIKYAATDNFYFNQANGGIYTFNISGSEKARIDSSGNMIVGKTSITESNEGCELRADGWLKAIRSDDYVATFRRNDGDGGIVEFLKDSTTVGSIGVESGGAMYIGGTTGSDSFIKFNSNEIVPCTSSGGNRDNAIDLGNFLSAYKDAYLSGGVYLGGTAAANKLDDYEEGTFTPIITGTGGTPTIAYTTQEAKYTKIGNRVTVDVRFIISSISGGSGSIIVDLPFTMVGSNAWSLGPCFHSGVGGFAVDKTVLVGPRTGSATNHVAFYEVRENTTYTAANIADLGGGDQLAFTYTYETNA